jgi:hypothetical protein
MPRGAWKGDKILTVCNYLTSTVKSDIRIARVLSEWETTDGGGLCPGISLLILLLISYSAYTHYSTYTYYSTYTFLSTYTYYSTLKYYMIYNNRYLYYSMYMYYKIYMHYKTIYARTLTKTCGCELCELRDTKPSTTKSV